MSEPAWPQPGETIADRYRVVRPLDRGSDAVYEVEDMVVGRARALKWFDPTTVPIERRPALLRAAQASAEFDSDHWVEVIDTGLDPKTGAPFVVMEMLRGERLDQRIQRVGRLSASDTLMLLTQIARALDRAHAHGRVYRRLVPELVFLEEPLKVKLLGFGLGATEQNPAAMHPTLYMAPEQADKMSMVGPATDVWAFGLLAYHALVGVPYFEGVESLPNLFRAILIAPLTSPVERAASRGVTLTPAFDGWFGRAVVRDPKQRASVGALVADLASMLGAVEPPVLRGNPKGSFYDQGLHTDLTPPGGTDVRELEMMRGNPKGSFYDRGLQPSAPNVWPWVVGVIIALLVATLLVLVFRR